MARKHRDPIEDFEEWQEHQYNPGYWVNRFPPHFPPKQGYYNWLLSWLDFVLILPFFFFAAWVYFFFEAKFEYRLLVIFFGIFGFIITLRTLKFRPVNAPPQSLKDEWRREAKKERKKELPKRRKDYK